MSDWYEYGDKLYVEVVTEVNRIFRKNRLTLNFDEINAMKCKQISKRIYTQLKALNRKKYHELCDYLWVLMYEELFGKDSKKSEKFKKTDPTKIADEVLSSTDPVTKYNYESEAERKESRFFEAITIDGDLKKRTAFERDFVTAENMWDKQTKQYFINVEDATRLKAYSAAGFKRVQWVTERDEKVCEECASMDGLIFPIDRVPDKPHPYCRCRIIPVD